MRLRPFQPEDAPAIAALFQDTVRRVASRDYGPAQVAVWAAAGADAERWRERLTRNATWVAEEEGTLLGFADLSAEGELDCLYVHADHQGEGIGRALLAAVEAQARQRGLGRLSTAASLTARPFFLRYGFRELARQEVARGGVVLVNFRMEKGLSADS